MDIDLHNTMAAFSNELADLFGDNLVSVVLFGSAVLGDFTLGKGDLDFVVVMRGDLSADDCDRIFELHDRMRAGDMGALAVQLEGTYYPLAIIGDPKNARAGGCYVGTGRKGWKPVDNNRNSMADYAIIRQYGITCYGEDIIHRFYNPSRQELLEEIRQGLNSNIETASTLNDPGYAVAMFNWAPRALCYALTNEMVSKTRAAEWYISEFPDSEWAGLVARSKEFRYPLTSDDLVRLDPAIADNVAAFLLHIREKVLR